MPEPNPEMATARRYAATISRFKKEKLLLQLSEDDFRDRVVRPLFQRMGLTDGRDLCGPDEEGKDCIFFGSDPLQQRILYAVQTKKGKLNMARRATENVTDAVTQLRTALQTEVCIATTRERLLPQFVVLCASGEINKTAREHIVKTLNDTRLVFWDSAEFIPKLDALYPEYWYGIDADKFPYYRRLKDSLETLNDYLYLDSDPAAQTRCPVTDNNYVPLYLYRATPGVKIGGQRKPAKPFEGIPIQAVIRKPEKLSLIVGDAGSGKSTALRRLAYSIATDALLKDEVGDIPILIKAADVAAADARLVDVAAAATAKLSATKQVVCVSAEDMRKGRVVLLIDALDEIGDPAQREAVIAKVVAFHDEYKGCPIVVASRRYAFPGQEGAYRRFVSYEIKPFNLTQAQKLVTHLVKHRSSSPVNAQEVLRRLKEVHGIDLNPLFVTLFVAIADVNAKEIPANITELFKKYTELMLGRWDVTKGFSQQYQFPLKDHLLQIVAHRMHSAKATRMPLSEARALIDKELQDTGHEADAKTLFAEIVERSGLIRQVGDGIEFKHLLFQEFFAGRTFSSVDVLRRVVHDRWWLNSIVFYFGNKPSGHAEIAALIASVSETYKDMQRFNAAVAIGQSIQACYMSKVPDKLASLEWVVKTLASVRDAVFKEIRHHIPGDFLPFILYFVSARPAVSLSQVNRLYSTLENQEFETPAIRDGVLFWVIIGMIETGRLGEVGAILKRYKPSDPLFLGGVYLQLLFAAGLRVSSNEDKELAQSMARSLEPKVKGVLEGLMNDSQSLLFEERNRKVEAIGPATLSLPGPDQKESQEAMTKTK